VPLAGQPDEAALVLLASVGDGRAGGVIPTGVNYQIVIIEGDFVQANPWLILQAYRSTHRQGHWRLQVEDVMPHLVSTHSFIEMGVSQFLSYLVFVHPGIAAPCTG
jgi:hypothetical protein